MKIHNNSPVSGQTARKTTKSDSKGVFKTLLDAEINETHEIEATVHEQQQKPEERAWHALNESVTLLDQAMKHLESGKAPTRQMMIDIEQLRSEVQQHLSGSAQSHELREADTLLAVEAERIRSLQS